MLYCIFLIHLNFCAYVVVLDLSREIESETDCYSYPYAKKLSTLFGVEIPFIKFFP